MLLLAELWLPILGITLILALSLAISQVRRMRRFMMDPDFDVSAGMLSTSILVVLPGLFGFLTLTSTICNIVLYIKEL